MMQAGRLGMATVLPYSNLNNFQLTIDNLALSAARCS